jgi:predicted Kef-type K+ transport protein
MPHDVTLIATIAVGFVLAFVFGYAAHRRTVNTITSQHLLDQVMRLFTQAQRLRSMELLETNGM